MKHRATKLILFLLLGAVINVAVAWGLRLWCSGDVHVAPEPTAKEIERVRLRFGRTDLGDYAWATESVSTRTVSLEHVFSRNYTGLLEVQMGWPVRSLCGQRWLNDRSLHCLFSVRPSHNLAPELPYYPLWPGFATNTIFYAAILWLPFAAFGRVRRRRRLKRGLCPACAYPVGTSDVCTECGKPTPQKSKMQIQE